MTRENPPAPPHIPDYELLREIGRGSYGTVWLARSVTGLYRAVKIVWRASFEDPQPYEREFRGIKEFAAVSLIEPRQLALLHVGRNDTEGFFYSVMELADDAATGREINPDNYVPYTLRELRARRGRLPAAETLALAVDLAGALAGLHAHKLVHRDIKPSNIIFVGGVPKLADIGLVTTAATAAVTISRVGNPGYMPPDFPGTPSADVYGLGKVLYEIATGRERDDYPRLPADLDKLPDRKALLELNEIFIRACASDPEKRYASGAALRDDLLLLQAGKSVRRLRATERQLNRALRVAAVLAIATAVAGAAAWVATRQARRAEAERDAVTQKSVYAAGLVRVQRALEVANFAMARRHLDALATLPADLRRFEYAALCEEAKGDPAVILQATGPKTVRTRSSPDGRLLAVHGVGMSLRLWDVAARKELRRISPLADLAGFSTDGRWLVGTNRKMELQRWASATGEPDPSVIGGTNRPLATIGADCALSFVDGDDGAPHAVRIWNFAERREILRLPLPLNADGTRSDFYRAAVAADGSRLALALLDGRLESAHWKLAVLEIPSGRLLAQEDNLRRIVALQFNGSGSELAVGFNDPSEIRLLDLSAQRWTWRQPVSELLNALAFSPSGDHLAAGSLTPPLRVFSLRGSQATTEWWGQNSGVEDLAWLEGGARLVTGGATGDLFLWPGVGAPGRRTVSDLGAAPSGGRSLCFSSDGELLAVTKRDAGVVVFNTRGMTETSVVPTPAQPLTFSHDRRGLWVLTTTGSLQCWELATRTLTREFAPLQPFLPCFPSADPTSQLALTGDAAGTLHWIDLGAGRMESIPAWHRGTIWWTALSPGGQLALTSGEDQMLRLADGRTRALLQETKLRLPAQHAAFAPDAKSLAVALIDGSIEIRNLPDLALLRRIPTDNAKLSCVLYSPDNARLWCTGSSGEVAGYDTRDWREVVVFRGPPRASGTSPESGSGQVLASDSTGRLLSLATRGGNLRVWRADLRDPR